MFRSVTAKYLTQSIGYLSLVIGYLSLDLCAQIIPLVDVITKDEERRIKNYSYP